MGFPAVHFDDTHIKMMLAKSVSIEDARDYCLMGCVEPQKSGRLYQWTSSAYTQWPICIALVLNQGVRNNIASSAGLDSPLGALRNGNHQRYLEQPERLAEPDTINDGNNILGHILGSRDASRQLASQAAAQTGLDPALLKKMPPAVAALLMGGLSKQGASLPGAESAGQADTGGIGAMLGALLDADKDGSVVDDLVGMARRLF